MKRTLYLALISFLFSIKSFANDGTISVTVQESFNKSFKNATEVQWSTVNSFYKADFTFNGQHVSAFFEKEGSLVAVTRHLLSTALPVTLQADLKKDYEDYWISDLFEVNDDEGTSYFVTLQKQDVSLMLKSSGSSWTEYRKLIK
jgi:Protein of unknown function (DUF2874).